MPLYYSDSKNSAEHSIVPMPRHESESPLLVKIGTKVIAYNFIIGWGCEPVFQTDAETTMINHVVDQLNKYYDREKYFVEFPTIFENIKNNDTKLEISASNTLQKVRLIRK